MIGHEKPKYSCGSTEAYTQRPAELSRTGHRWTLVQLKYVTNGPLVVAEELAEKGKSNQLKTAVFKDMVSAVKSNKPFQVFILAYLCFGLGMGMFLGLFFIFRISWCLQNQR